jgi:tetratricopeptide (TPR) repeat protein
LDAAAADSGRAVVVVVHGLGGVGKSTLAARFAHIHADRYAPVWWIIADSPAAIDTGLADLATALAPETAELPLEQRAELAVRWLATHDGWLLVLDNLTAPVDAAELLERVRTGTVVITSRQGGGWRGVDTIPLDVMPAHQTEDLLAQIVHAEWPLADLTGADRLCAEVGWLPLAVKQAGAYLAQTRITPAAYLDLLARFPARIFTATAEGGDAQRTMARVWRVTFDRLAYTPLAGQVLSQLAWYAPDAIPRTLLARVFDEPGLSEALGRLHAYSMITLTSHTVVVHRLVQAVTRTPDPNDPHRQPVDIALARDTAVATLADAVFGANYLLPADWPVFQTVLPHARALLNHTLPDTDTELLCHLANRLGIYLRNQGDNATAIALLTRAAHGSQRLYGTDHPHTLIMRNNLASAYQTAGDLARAIPLHEATLAAQQRVLGPDHPNTLVSRHDLAGAYQQAGDLGQAIPLYRATVADAERVLGPDHPNTLTSRNKLAHACQKAGDLRRAIPLYEVTLLAQQRVLGPNHPATLTSRNDLASAYQGAGDLRRAIPLYEATLADTERVLGPDHPQTLTSRNNLAGAYHEASDLRRAIPLYEATLAAQQRVLGPNHPDTLTSRNNLAGAYHEAGDLKRAIPLYEATLADTERVLGPDHPLTRAIRLNVETTTRGHD